MYELRKRDLPHESQLKLFEMLAFIKQPNNESEDSFLEVEGQKEQTKKIVEKLKLINQHRQLLTERKLQSTEKKYEVGTIALRFVRFLETNDQKMAAEHNSRIRIIQSKTQEAIRKNGLNVQAKHQIKLQVLQEEVKVLNGMG